MRLSRTLVVLLIAAGTLTACRDPQLISVRLKWLHQSQFAGFYAAEQLGFYKEAGLNVELLPGGPDTPAVRMVALGGEDFGVASADAILKARANDDLAIVPLLTIYRKNPMVLFVRDESEIRSVADFVGKRIGVKYGGSDELTYRAMLAAAGLSAEDVEEIPVKFDLTSFIEGDVDVWPGYAINEPLVVEAQGVKVRQLEPEDYGVVLVADTLFATEKTAQSRPGIVRAFVRATRRGWEWAIENPEKAAGFALEFEPTLRLEHEQKMMLASLESLDPDGQGFGLRALANWQATQSFLISHGEQSRALDLETLLPDGD